MSEPQTPLAKTPSPTGRRPEVGESGNPLLGIRTVNEPISALLRNGRRGLYDLASFLQFIPSGSNIASGTGVENDVGNGFELSSEDQTNRAYNEAAGTAQAGKEQAIRDADESRDIFAQYYDNVTGNAQDANYAVQDQDYGALNRGQDYVEQLEDATGIKFPPRCSNNRLNIAIDTQGLEGEQGWIR